MKKLKLYKSIIIIFSMAMILFNSCHEDFLTEEPYFASPVNFYQTESDINSAIIAIYDALHSGTNGWETFSWNMAFQSEDPTDYIVDLGGNPMDNFTVTPQSDHLYGCIQASYKGIYRANLVLESLEKEDLVINEDSRKLFVAEARFLRGLFNFWLATYYGDMPLVTSSDPNEARNRSNRDESGNGTLPQQYDFLIEDLIFAADNLPKASEASNMPIPYLGRATEGAALGFLAKAYAQRKDWENAKATALELINTNEYELFSGADYYKNFVGDWNNNGGGKGERIFEIQFIGGNVGEGNWRTYLYTPWGSMPDGGWSNIAATEEFFESFETNDLRYDATFLLEYVDIWSGDTVKYPTAGIFEYPMTRKHFEICAQYAECSWNFVLLRYSDILLLLSEAENMMNGPNEIAYSGINQVRERAGIEPLSSLDKETLRLSIADERAKELCFEGWGYIDYVRQGLLERSKKLGYDVQEKHYRMPIPQEQIDINPNLIQNPGYASGSE